MLRALPISVVLVALLVGFALPGVTSGARSSRQAAVLPEWLGPSNLGESGGRLKRVDAVAVPQPEPVDNAWREPAAAAELTEEPNAWRTGSVIRPATVQPAAAPAQQPADNADDYDAAVITATNAIRRSHGLDPLRTSQGLTAAADQHSHSMAKAGYFAHESADGSAFWKRIQTFYGSSRWQVWSVGENLLWSSPDVDAGGALKLWLASPEHRANLLSPKWREIGVSAVHAARAPGTFGGREVTIVTTDFGVRH